MMALNSRFYVGLLGIVLAAACSSSEGGQEVPAEPDAAPGVSQPDAGAPRPDAAPDPNERTVFFDGEGCHEVFAQENLPTFELDIHPEVWALLLDDWMNGDIREEMDLEYEPYRPVTEFRYGDVVIKNAVIRLRGNPTYWLEQNKMQFQLAFDKNDPTGHFLGLKRLAFDAATLNRSFMRDRLGLYINRHYGLPAPCANNARLVVNGEYYGLFTNIEKIDEEFLDRAIPEAPDGDLWKRANWTLKTNLETGNDNRIDAMRDASTVAGLEEYLDVAQAIQIWAVDAVIPNADGPWAGGLNFYMYDHPTRGKFILLPWDLDGTFTRLEPSVDPYVWHKEERFHGRPWYDLALTDPAWFNMYVATIADVIDKTYRPEILHPVIEAWAEQINEAALTDPNKPFDNDRYLRGVEEMFEYVTDRRNFLLGQWLPCWQNGGTADADGYCVPPAAEPPAP